MSSASEKAAQGALIAIKKILAARGELDGNFYAVPSNRINEGGLVVTLLARDPKGARARAQGKKLLKELKTTKLARGRVVFYKNKLYFEVHQAKSLPGAKLKKALRKGMGDEKLQKFLKTALIGSPKSKPVDDADEAGMTSEELDALAQGETDLDDLIEEQTRILEMGDTLDGFLSDQDDDTAAAFLLDEAERKIEEIHKAIARAVGKEPTFEQAIQLTELHLQILEAKAIEQDLDPSLIPQVGESLDDVLTALSTSSQILLLMEIDLDEDEDEADDVVPTATSPGLSALSLAIEGKPTPIDYIPGSPYPDEDSALPSRGARLPEVFPPAGWVENVIKHATGRKTSKIRPSREATQIKQDRLAFQTALAEGDDTLTRGVLLARELSARLDSPYTGRFAKSSKREDGETQHPDEARIQRSIIALQAMLAAGDGFTVQDDQEALLLAVNALSPEQQLDLFRADAMSGKKLYSALYLAAKGNPALKAEFAALKSVAQLAKITDTLNQDDRSGQSAKLMGDMLTHLDESGVSESEKQAFVDKMSFKLTIRASQGSSPDIPAPDTSKAGWRTALTGRMLSTLAETPEVSDESLLKTLDMPPKDLVRALGSAFTGDQEDFLGMGGLRREGDFRIIRLASELADQNAGQDDAGWDKMKALMDGLESGALDRNRFRELSLQGEDIEDILDTLKTEAGQLVDARRADVNLRLGAMAAGAKARKTELEEQLSDLPDVGERDPEQVKAAAKIATELLEVQGVIDDFDGVSWSKEQVQMMNDRFGQAALGMMQGTLTIDPKKPIPSGSLDTLRQMKTQIDALSDPKKLKAGLEKMGMVLPTAGRYLRDCAWVYSTAQDLVRTALAIQEEDDTFTLKRHPIVILDQTDGDGSSDDRVEKWNANEDYLKMLEKRHADVGLCFEHVSMGDINGMIRGSGIEQMFDTTGENMAGYGGARNMAYLLGPVILDAARSGESIADITPDKLVARIQDVTMKDSVKLFMGDDGDYVAPGMISSRAAIADEGSKDHYAQVSTLRGGRDTMGVSAGIPNGAIDSLESGGMDAMMARLFSSNKWNSTPKKPGIGCTFSDPRFCLNVPTGKEEKQHEAIDVSHGHFTMAMHLSGDRKGSPAGYLKGNIAYTNMSEVINSLISPSDLPWNKESTDRKKDGEEPLSSLDDVLSVGADEDKRKIQQKDFLGKLVTWRADEDGLGPLQLDGDHGDRVQTYLDDHPELDAESRDELVKVKAVYEDAKRQAQQIKRFVDALFAALAPDATSDDERSIAMKDAVDDDPKAVLKAIRDVRSDMEDDGIKFDGSNRMVRDFALVCESVGGGSFNELAGVLTA